MQNAPSVGSIGEKPPELLWERTANSIRSEIVSGSYPAGARLPAERELCERMGVSRVTLRAAIAHLVEEGLLGTGLGRGWYVMDVKQAGAYSNRLESFAESAARMGLVATSRVLTAEVVPASFDQAEIFGLAPGAELFHLARIRQLNGLAVAYDESWVPLELEPQLIHLDFSTGSLFKALESAGYAPDHADSTVEAQKCEATVARLLQIEIGDPVLLISERTKDRADKAILISKVQYRSDRYRLQTAFSRSNGH